MQLNIVCYTILILHRMYSTFRNNGISIEYSVLNNLTNLIIKVVSIGQV